MIPIKTPKKLIEVALPLDAINAASAKEKSIRHGHPSTLHLWWARRPLAAARAVIFAQMVNDPGGERGYFAGMTKAQAAQRREELFKIIEDLVLWENINNEEVLSKAREAIQSSWRETCRLNKAHPSADQLFNPEVLPAFHDPFAGGGALPLEAQRLGLESFASDLNPVAVTINKAMIEIPPRFADCPPVGPLQDDNKQGRLLEGWSGARGLAEDVRRYGAWMRVEAERRIGALYPTIVVRNEDTSSPSNLRPDLAPYVGEELTVIAWLWARTVRSPNPAFSHVAVPLVSTFLLSSKEGKRSYIEPVVNGDNYSLAVRFGEPPISAANGTTAGKRGGFICILSGAPIDYKHIRSEGAAGRLGYRLMAVVAEGHRGRVYLTPTEEHDRIARSASPKWRPETELHGKCRVNVANYGLDRFGDLFTDRQLVALETFSELVAEVVEKARRDAIKAGFKDDERSLDTGGSGATAYAQALGVYMAFAVDRSADYWSSLSTWHSGAKMEALRNTFGRQALPMSWDYAEGNPFSGSSGNWSNNFEWCAKALDGFPLRVPLGGVARAEDATSQKTSQNKVVSTDPPYYDNIGYADLSDFFYVWLRRNLREIFPGIYATLAAPKTEELVATPYRHSSKSEAESFFLSGMTRAMHNLAEQAHPAFPVTIYYAFKQAETTGESGTHSSGWETFLEAVLQAGFALTGTWPMRTEMSNRMIGAGANALASSIVLVCRQRAADAPTVSRREFIRELNAELPEALLDMTRGGVNSPVAPVDLSQAIIGPGMAIFSKYAAVLEADGRRMSVRSALQLINRFLSEDDFDSDSQFCLHWFETVGWAVGRFGEADVLARAKGTSVGGLAEAGVLESSGGNVRLFKWREYPTNWSPEDDQRPAVWEMLHHIIRALNLEGETSAGALLARMMDKAEPIRALAYRLYTLCERKGWSDEARSYNELITSWQSVEAAATDAGPRGTQVALDI